MRPVTNLKIFGFRLAVVVLAAFWLALFMGTHLPAAVDFSPEVNDKVKHFGAFFVLGFLMCYVTNSPLKLKRFLAIAAIGMTYAAIDETTQHFIPGRYPDRMDFVADSIGLWAAIIFYVIARHFYYAKQTNPSAKSA